MCSWGALWGVVFGFVYLAPKLIRLYEVQAVGFGQWLSVDLLLIGLFAAIGASLSLVSVSPVIVWRAARGSDFASPAWAYSLITCLALPLAYFSSSAMVEWASFGAVYGYAAARVLVIPALIFYAFAPVLLLALYRRRLHQLSGGTSLKLVGTVLAIAMLGVGLLPLRATSVSSRAPSGSTPLEALAAREQPKAPLLFLGIDGAEWRLMLPLLNQGALPNLHRLIFSGIHGDVQAIWGPERWSSPAWAAITTGYPREETGIYRDLAEMIPGLATLQEPLRFDLTLTPIYALEMLAFERHLIQVVPPPRSILRRPPFWELVSRAGRKAAVIRFRYTFPAAGQADYIISDWVGRDSWSFGGLDPQEAAGASPLVWPPRKTSEFLEDFSPRAPFDESLFSALLPVADRRLLHASRLDPTQVVGVSADVDQRSLRVARAILRDEPSLSVLAVYLGGLDGVSHNLWRYRFPEDFPEDPPSPDEVKRLGPVLDRYLEFLDREIGRLIAAFPVTPNVIVVSDHGFGPAHHHPMFSGWHGEHGVFIAAGPDVSRRNDHLSVDYLDVAPTVLRLLGFRAPSSMGGHSLVPDRRSLPDGASFAAAARASG